MLPWVFMCRTHGEVASLMFLWASMAKDVSGCLLTPNAVQFEQGLMGKASLCSMHCHLGQLEG